MSTFFLSFGVASELTDNVVVSKQVITTFDSISSPTSPANSASPGREEILFSKLFEVGRISE